MKKALGLIVFVLLATMMMGTVSATNSITVSSNASAWYTTLNQNFSINITASVTVPDTSTNVTLLNFTAPTNVLIWYGGANTVNDSINNASMTCSNGGNGAWVNCTHPGIQNITANPANIVVNFNISASAEANYTLTIYSIDNNSGTSSATLDLGFDVSPPSTTDDAPIGWQNTAFTVTLTPNDTVSGVAYTTYSVDGGSLVNGTSIDMSVYGDGNHSIDYYSVDNAGHVETTNTVYAALDTSNPIVNLGTPANNTWNTSRTVTFTFTPVEMVSNLRNCSLYTSDGGWGVKNSTTSPTNDSSNSLSYTFSADGIYLWNVECYDLANNSAFNATNYTIKIDTTAPNIPTPTLDVPDNSSINSNINITVTNTVESTSGLAVCNFTLYNSTALYQVGAASFTGSTSNNYNITATIAGPIPDDSYKLSVNCTDNAGNSNYSLNKSFVIDATAPNQSVITAPSTGDNISGVYTITASADDAFTGIQKVEFLISGSSRFNDTTAPYSYSWNTSAEADGSYTLTVVAYDYAGNPNQSSTVVVTVDNTPPTITAIYPSTISYFNSSFEFNISVVDDTSGVPLSGKVFYAVTNSSGDNVTAWIPMNNLSTDIHNNNYNISVTLPSSDGVYNLTVNATDYAGNSRLSNVTEFGYDTHAPQVSYAVSDSALTGGNTVQFNVTVTDLNISAINITVRHLLTNTTWLLASLTNVNTGTNLTELSFTPNYSGSYQLEVVALDHVQPAPYSTTLIKNGDAFFTVYNGRPSWNINNGNVSIDSENFAQFKNHYDMPVPFYPGDPNDKQFRTNISNFQVIPIFTDKPFFAGPDEMQNLAYNYSFVINTSNLAANDPVIINFTAPGVIPAYVENVTVATPEGNQTMTMIGPAMSDPTSSSPSFLNKFSVYVNGVLYDTNSSSNVTGRIGFDSNGNPAGWFVLNLTGLSNTTTYSVSIPMATIPPIRLNSQRITGFDPANPPQLGSNLTTEYVVNITATNEYYIADNVSVLFMFPVNVTKGNTTYNISSNVSIKYWNGSAFVPAPTTNTSSCITVNDSLFNENITVCIAEYRYQISNTSDLDSWKNGTTKVVKGSAVLSFPILDEVVPAGATGTTNQYKASVTMGTDAGVYIPADKVPNISSATDVKVYVNGRLLSSTDYVLGSVKINGTALSAGANNIKVVYSVPSSSTSGGVSGPGITVPEEISQMFVFTALEAGSTVRMQISEEGMHVQEIELTVKNPATNVKITVEKTADKPAEVTQELTGRNVYEYLKISKQNIQNEDIEKVKFKFKVSKQWFADNNLDPETTGLDRFNEETQEWEHYSATMLDSDDEYYYFEAEVPGFSVFAITAAPVQGAGEVVTPEQPQQPPEQPSTGEETGKPSEEVVTAQPINVQVAIGLVALIIFVFAVALFLKRRR